MEGDALFPTFNFYGSKARKRSLHVRRSLEKQAKRLKEERCPTVYHSSILGPSIRWQIFFRQQDAFDFASTRSEDLHVFAFESKQPGKDAGQRQYLTTSYPVFWHYYMQLEDSQRHHYEVIPEGAPCKLYFDLEYQREANPASDGVNMVNTLIKLTCACLRAAFGLECSRNSVLDLDASTCTKFSRHLIFQLKNAVFKDNIHAGAFVRTVFSKLEAHLVSLDDEAGSRTENSNHSQAEVQKTSVKADTVSGEGDGVDCGAVKDTSAENRNQGVHVFPAVFEDVCSSQHSPSSDQNREMDFLQDEQGEVTETVSEIATSSCADGHNRLQLSIPEPQTNSKVKSAEQTEHPRVTVAAQRKDEDEKDARKSDGLAADTERSKAESSDEQATEADTERPPFELDSSQFQSLLRQFTLQELKSLFVKDKDGRNTCFADLGVYTKNRNFRLYKSCKLGKNNPFHLSPENTFVPTSKDNEELEQAIFLSSLIANVSLDDEMKILTFSGDPNQTGRVGRGRSGSTTARSLSQEECMEGFTKSPYPEVDEFILHLVAADGRGGSIRRWRYFPEAEILSYDIVGYRFCYNIQRQHRSNNIKLIVDLKKGVWYQKCHDPDCQEVGFKSEEQPLPENTLLAHFFDSDFEEETPLGTADNQPAACGDFSAEETEEDAACLAALEETERRLASSDENHLIHDR